MMGSKLFPYRVDPYSEGDKKFDRITFSGNVFISLKEKLINYRGKQLSQYAFYLRELGLFSKERRAKASLLERSPIKKGIVVKKSKTGPLTICLPCLKWWLIYKVYSVILKSGKTERVIRAYNV